MSPFELCDIPKNPDRRATEARGACSATLGQEGNSLPQAYNYHWAESDPYYCITEYLLSNMLILPNEEYQQ